MNDNGIKSLIDKCTDRIEGDFVDSEEIKGMVMAKIEEGRKKNFSSENNEPDVEPKFVQKNKTGNLRFKLGFTAAACLGIMGAGIYFAGSKNDLISAGYGEDISLPGTELGEDISLTGQGTDMTDAAAETADEKKLEVVLLDGTKQTYGYGSDNGYIRSDGTDTVRIIELGENDTLWFIGNGEKINVTEAAGEKSYYIYTYINPYTESEHTVVIGNTAEPSECGYFEMYLLEGVEGFGKWVANGRNCYSNTETSVGMAESYKPWVYDALESLGLTALDAKASERASGGEVIDMDNAVYIVGSSVPVLTEAHIIYESDILKFDDPLPDGFSLEEEFSLLNGCRIKIVLDNTNQGTERNPYFTMGGMSREEYENPYFETENGRIYFIGGSEHIDITDDIANGGAYIYSYTHPERNKLHYIAAGGTADNFRYAEIYPTYGDYRSGELRWECEAVGGFDPLDEVWLDSVFQQLDIDICGTSYCDIVLDLTAVGENGEEAGEEHTAETQAAPVQIDPLPEGAALVDEFYLLDNSLVRIASENGRESVYMYGGANEIDIFSNENGRAYFVGNGEREDITDIIEAGETYVYSYVHPERNMEHYIAAGKHNGEFGYAEVFLHINGKGEKSWETHGYNCIGFSEAEETGSGLAPWLRSFLDEIDEEVKAQRYGGGGGDKDFSYLFFSF